MSKLLPACLVAVAAVTPGADATASGPPPSAATAPSQDAQAYAETYDVSPEEATRRLALQLAAGDYQATLAARESATLAGVWIEHTPRFRVVVAVTDAAAETRVRALAPARVAPVVDVRTARHPLTALRAAARTGYRLVERLGFAAASASDVRANRAVVTVRDRTAVEAALRRAGVALPAEVALRAQPSFARPVADVHGGLSINACTSGFSVQSPGGTKGIALAGHCPDDQSYNGTNLPFQQQVYTGDADSQWNSSPATLDVRPYVLDASQDPVTPGFRFVRGSVARASQVVGSTVCKYGTTTGFGCGTIHATDGNPGNACVPNATASFVHVMPDPNGDLAEGGDSGGPWFSDNNAYGTMSCQASDGSAWYTPIDTTLTRVGVHLLTGVGPGEQLTTEQQLRSPDGSHRAVMQADGNFVVYNSSNVALWASGTAGNPGGYLSVGLDGNFVVNRADGLVLWGANTMGNNVGAYLTLQNDGNLVLVPSGPSPVVRWGTRSSVVECRRLDAGASLWSPDGRYRATMQLDGNLVVYNQANAAVWASGTQGNTSSWLQMQCDGNAVIYRPGPAPVWDTGTANRSTSRLTLHDDGTLRLYTRDNVAIWGSDGDTLYYNKKLRNDQQITSRNGAYFTRMQADGNLVTYRTSGGVVWASGTSAANSELVMQWDGNAVIYANGGAIWSTGTQNNQDAVLRIKNDGRLVVVTRTGSEIWARP